MRPLRNPVVQTVLARLLAWWMGFCFATIRWTYEGRDAAEAIWKQGGGVLVVFWHSRVALGSASWPAHGTPTRAMVSLSPDGEFFAKALAHRGFPSIRGSSANKDKADRAKGGSHALREGLRQLKVGGLAITPDGPRGPARQMAEGLPVLAKLSGAPALLIGVSCKPAIRLNSWDRAVLPLPFGRGAIVYDAAWFPKGAAMDDVVRDWTDRLTAAEVRADEITGLERV